MVPFCNRTTCWRLRRRGLLAQYAGAGDILAFAPASELAAVARHVDGCPQCAAEVDTLRRVTALLQGGKPAAAAPEASLAARGALWSVLESTIAETPQLPAAAWIPKDGPQPPSPRLERVASLLATPRSAPFAAAAAVSLAFVAGIVIWHPYGGHAGDAPAQVASARSDGASNSAPSALVEITAYPIVAATPVVPAAASASARAEQVRPRAADSAVTLAIVAAADRSETRALRHKNPAPGGASRPMSSSRGHRLPAPVQVARVSAIETLSAARPAAAANRSATDDGAPMPPAFSRPATILDGAVPAAAPPGAFAADSAGGTVGDAAAPPDPSRALVAKSRSALRFSVAAAGAQDGRIGREGHAVAAAVTDGAAALAADLSGPDSAAESGGGSSVAIDLRCQRLLFSYATR